MSDIPSSLPRGAGALLLAAVLLAGCAGGPGARPPVEDQSVPAAPLPVTPVPSPGVSVTPLPGMGAPAATPLPIPPAKVVGTPPVIALVAQADRDSRAGNLEAASASLERALRIDPANGTLWNRLAVLRLAQGNPQQAAALAAKSNSLAGSNVPLQIDNWHLIARARHAQGDAAGARAAEQRAAALGDH